MISSYIQYLKALGKGKIKGATLFSDILSKTGLKEKENISEDKCTYELNGVKFCVTWDPEILGNMRSSENCFILGKAQPMIEHYIAMNREQEIKKVFDIGILQGGSIVLFDQIYRLDKIVTIDLAKQPVEALSKYIEQRNKSNSMKPYYGVNQADRNAMESILLAEFPANDIDLIVDDGSHFYVETREAFNISFPFLKTGGHYIIEDWGWAHWTGEPWQTAANPFGKSKAMSNLLIELFMLAASRPDFIKDIIINHNIIVVKKGSGQLPAQRFDIGNYYMLRGKTFRAWL